MSALPVSTDKRFNLSTMTEPDRDISRDGRFPVGTATIPLWFNSPYSAPLPPLPVQGPPLHTHAHSLTHSSRTLCSLSPPATDLHVHEREDFFRLKLRASSKINSRHGHPSQSQTGTALGTAKGSGVAVPMANRY